MRWLAETSWVVFLLQNLLRFACSHVITSNTNAQSNDGGR